MAYMKKSITIDQALKRTMTLFQAFTHMIISPVVGHHCPGVMAGSTGPTCNHTSRV